MRSHTTSTRNSVRQTTAVVLLIVFTIVSGPLTPRADATINSTPTHASATLGETLVASIEGLLERFGSKNTVVAESATVRRTPREIQAHGDKPRLAVGQHQQLTALAVDHNGEVVDGLGFTWSSNNPAVAEISRSGIVKALASGEVELTASEGTIQGSARLTILSSLQEASSGQEKTTSAPRSVVRSIPERSVRLKAKEFGQALISPAAYPVTALPLCNGGDCTPPAPNNQTAPQNNIGKPLNAPQTLTTESEATIYPGSSNYNKTFPIASLTGRGENGVVMAAFYNSQPWVYESSTGKYSYNTNWDWPGPGFNLHFGKLNWQTVGGTTQYLVITPDGTRHTLVSTGATGKLQTNDGTFILVTTPEIGSSYIAHFPDGTVVTYDVAGANNYQYASRVQDRNGNFSTIAYTSTIPQINYVTDDQGRQIQFFYDGNNNLTSITAPDFGGGRRTVVQFSYTTISVTSSFSNAVTVILNGSSNGNFTVPSRLYYPATGAGYLFTYGAYGMVKHLSQRLNMTASTDGTEAAWSDYNYPSSGPLSDVPRFTQRQEWWSGADVTVPVTYTYANTTEGSYNVYSVTDPLGRVSVQKSGTSGASNGLLTISELQYPAGTALSRVTSTWVADAGGGGPQLTRTDFTDVPANLTWHQEFSYPGGTSYNNPSEQREYGFNNELLRRSAFTYITNTNYTNPAVGKPRLLHLIRVIIYLTTPDEDSEGRDLSFVCSRRFCYDAALKEIFAHAEKTTRRPPRSSGIRTVASGHQFCGSYRLCVLARTIAKDTYAARREASDDLQHRRGVQRKLSYSHEGA